MKRKLLSKQILKRADEGGLEFVNPPEPEVHPYRQILVDAGLKLWHVSFHLGIAQPNFTAFLNGTKPLKKQSLDRLELLIAEIKNAQEDS